MTHNKRIKEVRLKKQGAVYYDGSGAKRFAITVDRNLGDFFYADGERCSYLLAEDYKLTDFGCSELEKGNIIVEWEEEVVEEESNIQVIGSEILYHKVGVLFHVNIYREDAENARDSGNNQIQRELKARCALTREDVEEIQSALRTAYGEGHNIDPSIQPKLQAILDAMGGE